MSRCPLEHAEMQQFEASRTPEAPLLGLPARRGCPAEMQLSIFVVSYNTRELTRRCLRSILEADPAASHEIIVVDNASADGSADMVERDFPSVRLLRSATNLGFAAGNNLARSHARGERFLLLNPDTRVRGDAIDRLLAFS